MLSYEQLLGISIYTGMGLIMIRQIERAATNFEEYMGAISPTSFWNMRSVWLIYLYVPVKCQLI